MDGEQHRAPTHKHNQRKRKKAKGSKGGGASVDRVGRDGEVASGGVVAQGKPAPTGTERKQQGSSNINEAPSRPQHHQTQASPVKAAGSNDSSGGDGGLGSKKSKKRRRKEAAQAAAAQAARHQPPPSPPGVTEADATAVAPPHSGGGAKKTKKAKKAQNKAANSTAINDEKPSMGTAERGGSPPAASPPGNLARGSGGGRSGGPKIAAAAAAAGAGGPGAPRLSELQQRMRQKLEGAQFRMINETLYTSESKASLAKFKREPELFDVVRYARRDRYREIDAEKDRSGGRGVQAGGQSAMRPGFTAISAEGLFAGIRCFSDVGYFRVVGNRKGLRSCVGWGVVAGLWFWPDCVMLAR